MEKAVFDAYATEYDASFTETEVGQKQRNRVWELLLSSGIAEKKHKILEVNCGTGVDAIWLTKQGNKVLATDISGEMISIGRQKSEDLHLEIDFQTLGFEDLETLKNEPSFDLIFSNFGGLNCIGSTQFYDFLKTANNLLRPDGKLVMVVMPRFCIWESVYYLLKFQPHTAFRRLQKKAKATIGGQDLWVYYYNPYKVIEWSKKWFSPHKIAPVGLFLPPSYLSGFFEKNQRLLKILDKAEHWFSNISALSAVSDHYYLELKKR